MGKLKGPTKAAESRSPRRGRAHRSKAKPIWDELIELSEQIPEEEMRKLPVDGAEQHDHYIYGCPKTKQ
jgi:hypothetical protein